MYMNKMCALVTYIVAEQDDVPLTRTKLVKLVYLSDIYSVKERGTPITGVSYSKYYLGPYSERIIEATSKLDAERINVIPFASNKGIIYNHTLLSPKNYEVNLSRPEKKIVDRVIKDYGRKDTKELVKVVLEREEVKEKDKFEVIEPKKETVLS